MYKEDPEQRLEPSGEVKTGDVEQHPSISMQVGFKQVLLRRSSGEEGAGREDGAGEAHQYLKERQMKREGKRQKRNGGQGPENPGECGH